MKANVKTANDRLVPVEIAGTLCYLNFSVRAAKLMNEKFGSIENAENTANDGNMSKALEATIELYAILIEEGARYLSKVDGVDDPPRFSADDLETVLNMSDVTEMQEQLAKAIKIGSGQEIEADQPKKEEAAPEQ